MTAIIQNRCSFRTELAECGNRHKKIGYLCFIIITLLTTLPMKRHHLLFLFAAFIAITSSAQKLDNLVELKQKSENPLFHHLDKAPRTPAFECEGYWAWGSSVVKGDDGKYHMFVSRFPKSFLHPPLFRLRVCRVLSLSACIRFRQVQVRRTFRQVQSRIL